MKLIHARSAFLVWLAAAAPAVSQSPLPIFPPPLQARESAIPLPGIFAVGDLDADGDADLLGEGIGVNDGNARFTAATVSGLYSFYPLRTVIADLDGDGLGDILSSEWFGTSPRIDMNAGSFHFVAPTTALPALTPIGSLTRVSNIAVADVDSDGDLDVMIGLVMTVGGFPGLPPNLWLNDGTSGFTPAPAANVPPNSLGADILIMQDVDANGYPDAIFAGFSVFPAGSPNITCMKNTNGVFSITPGNQWTVNPALDVEVGDFNGDGRIDLAAAALGGTAINFNSATGFAGFLAPSGPMGSVRAIDVNVDGTDEILVGIDALSLRAVLPNGSVGPALQTWPGKYLGVPTATGPESVRDLDGDGDRDLIVNGSGYHSLLMNSATGALVSIAASDVGVSISNPLVGDVNGDGHPDVLGFPSKTSPQIVIALNDGEGALSPAPSVPITLPGPAFAFMLHAFDRDGDGDCDLYAARNIYTTGSGALNDVLFDNAGGTFSPIASITGTGDACSVQSGDLDGDGDADLLLGRRIVTTLGGNGVAGPMLMLRNLGAAGFAAPMAIGTNHATYDLDLGDFDGDGSLDVFQTNALHPMPAGDPCVVYLNSGAGTFNPQTQNFTGYYAVAGDLNADGRSDVVVDGTVHLSLGGAAFGSGPSLPSPLGAPPILTDVDVDGDLDLVESDLTVMLNLGAGVFAPRMPYLYQTATVPPVDMTESSSAVDLDHDGDPDFVTTAPIVFTNYSRQLVRGSVPRPGRPASLEIYGAQNAAYLLYASNGTAQFPFAPFGTVLIDPASAVLAAAGTLVLSGVQGSASLSGTLPPNPALIGWTTYWQSVDLTNLKTTNRVTMTVLNY